MENVCRALMSAALVGALIVTVIEQAMTAVIIERGKRRLCIGNLLVSTPSAATTST
jgi:hypothetical protein